MSDGLRPRRAVRAVVLAALLGMTACGSVEGGRGEADSSLRLASIFLNAGAPDAALKAADEALSRRPRDVEALALRADALAAMDQGEAAQQAYMTAIAQDPRAVAPRIGLGRLLIRSNPAAAEAVFNDVLARQPANAIALNNLGIARDLQGRHGEAQPAYRAARTVDPKMTGASVNLGLSLVLSGNMTEAVRELSPLAAAPDAPATVLENLGLALAASGDPVGATRVLGRVMGPADISQVLAQYRGRVEQARPVSLAGPVTPGPVAPVPVAPVAALPVPVAPVPVARAPVGPAPVAPTGAPERLSAIAVPAARVEPVAAVPQAAVAAPGPVAVPVAVPVAAPVTAAVPVAERPAEPAAGARAVPVVTAEPVPASVVLASVAPPPPVLAPAERPVAAPSLPERAVVESPVAGRREAGRLGAEPSMAGAVAGAVTAQPVAVPSAPPARMTAGRVAYAQLAAAETEGAAPAEWERLRRRLGTLLQDREAVTLTAEVGGRTVWRLRTPFAGMAEAQAFCVDVRAAGGACWAAFGS